jgi:hypothetical protein
MIFMGTRIGHVFTSLTTAVGFFKDSSANGMMTSRFERRGVGTEGSSRTQYYY